MFKFKDNNDSEVWIDPEAVVAVSHVNDDALGQHFVAIYMNNHDLAFEYQPSSSEDCRAFLFRLFKAMGEEYKYE